MASGIFLINERYRIDREIDSNHFAGHNVITNEMVTIKIESIQAEQPHLETEFNIYRSLRGCPGIPWVHWFGLYPARAINVLVMESLGPTLEDLFGFCRRHFSLKTVLLLARQLISRVELLHSYSILSLSVGPKFFAIGLAKHGVQVHFTGLDQARIVSLETSPSTSSRSQSIENVELLPTTPTVKSSFRGDLELLGYTLLYFIHGSLPWWRQETLINTADSGSISAKTPDELHSLCSQLAPEFSAYFTYVYSLSSATKPDYAYLRSLFGNLFTREGFQDDRVFDWQVQRAREDASGTSNTLPLTEPLHPSEVTAERMLEEIQTIWDLVQHYEDGVIISTSQAKLQFNSLSDQQWRALFDFYRALMQQYTDYIFAIEHPCTMEPLRDRTRAEHQLPARIWENGIQPFLELLGVHLPSSQAHSHRFVRFAHTSIGLLSEVSTVFSATWSDWLANLTCFRAVLEEHGSSMQVDWARLLEAVAAPRQ